MKHFKARGLWFRSDDQRERVAGPSPIFVRRAAPQANRQFDGRLATQIPRVRQDLRSLMRLPLWFHSSLCSTAHKELEDKQHGHRIGNNTLQYGDHRERPHQGRVSAAHRIDRPQFFLFVRLGWGRLATSWIPLQRRARTRLSIHFNRPETLLIRTEEETPTSASRSTSHRSHEASIRDEAHIIIRPAARLTHQELIDRDMWLVQNLLTFATDTPCAVDNVGAL